MIYGFTGTRYGMTLRQKRALDELLSNASMFKDLLHHGGCFGADVDAHQIAGLCVARHIHPGSEEQHKYWTQRSDYAQLCRWKPFLERNREIVGACEMLVAAPRNLKEELRSGTWATIRYARDLGRPVVILDP